MQVVNKERVARLYRVWLSLAKQNTVSQDWLIHRKIRQRRTGCWSRCGTLVCSCRQTLWAMWFCAARATSRLGALWQDSHIDTVVQGGAYDGTIGVVGALEVLHILQDEELERPLEVIIFRAEESSRFGFATIGSKMMAGVGDPDKFSSAPKAGDLTFKEALTAWGCDPAAYEQARREEGCFKSFWEMHIEQGKVLEETGQQIGIVHNTLHRPVLKLSLKVWLTTPAQRRWASVRMLWSVQARLVIATRSRDQRS